ncbi:MAG: DNA-binding protein WhiA [Papillibacter sp.]|jgi:DNA-binding protein WhiA|nr:DNA-binding protein WhiA [Papillibacter sp.]
MSFSYDTKTELCRAPMEKKCCINAELYGILLYCNTFGINELRIMTEHRQFAQRAEKLLSKAAGLSFDIKTGDEEAGLRYKVSLVINKSSKMEALLMNFGYDSDRNFAHHINLAVLEDDCCKASFIRGALLAGGSITDPNKGYHLELVTGHYGVARGVYSLLLDMGFMPRNIVRNGNYVTYFKQSEAIEDLLTLIGAPLSAMKIMNAKVEKEITNKVNRRLNCDEANLDKMVQAAQEQLEAIHKLESSGKLRELTDKLREAAELRRDNPELSLAQLAALTSPPVTKSCLNHRLRKIMEIANKNAE